MRRFLSPVLLVAFAALAGGEEHLLAGARAFRAGNFVDALVEFRVAQRLGDPRAGWYVAASLEKTGRAEEAVEAFAAAEAGAPTAHDVLLDYYRALACYDAKLYACADRLFASIGDRSGPRLAAQLQATRAALAKVLTHRPPTTAIDWYLTRAGQAAVDRQRALAAACLDEAQALAARRPDHYRLADVKRQREQLARVGADAP